MTDQTPPASNCPKCGAGRRKLDKHEKENRRLHRQLSQAQAEIERMRVAIEIQRDAIEIRNGDLGTAQARIAELEAELAPRQVECQHAAGVTHDATGIPCVWCEVESLEADAKSRDVIEKAQAERAKRLMAKLATARRDALAVYIQEQRAWSERTFGPGMRTIGLTRHIRKELIEIAADPHDVTEWIDVVILALDGAWRCGKTPKEVALAMLAKQAVNFAREWPPPGPDDEPSEHVRDLVGKERTDD